MINESFMTGFFFGIFCITFIILYVYWKSIRVIPDIIPLQTQNDMMSTALDFYAKKSNYNFYIEGYWESSQIELDEGRIATATLTHVQNMK